MSSNDLKLLVKGDNSIASLDKSLNLIQVLQTKKFPSLDTPTLRKDDGTIYFFEQATKYTPLTAWKYSEGLFNWVNIPFEVGAETKLPGFLGVQEFDQTLESQEVAYVGRMILYDTKGG